MGIYRKVEAEIGGEMIIDGTKSLSSVERLQYAVFLEEIEKNDIYAEWGAPPVVERNGITFSGPWTGHEIDEVMRQMATEAGWPVDEMLNDIAKDQLHAENHANRLDSLCQQLPKTELTTEAVKDGSVFKGLVYAIVGMVAVAVGIWLGRR